LNSCRPYSEVVGGFDTLNFSTNFKTFRIMADSKNNLNKEIHIRLKLSDFNVIHKRFSSSTCRKLSEYVRDVLLNKPIIIKQRNQSLDDFMTEMIKLRNEL